ncbi:MAG: bifunctional glutamate N-acetyltransferase/amino-acid acetyltransferase ArgJ [Clostridium sp.]|nr:bifunctional glutamate N-acetyltransferase/amino-acid acetyltransferase ArgJ [Clostridium sp.]
MSGIIEIQGAITAPKGFQAAGLRAGIKPGKMNKDMAMVVSTVPCVAAGVFTRNLVKAAPVQWDAQILEKHGVAQAVVVNSGIANACTGEQGYEDVKKTAKAVAKELDIKTEQVVVMSTGVIGQPLPMDTILQGVGMLREQLSQSEQAGHAAAEAIMTTDTHSKEIAIEFSLKGKTVRMAGMCKGSGMIHPNMGTMLGVITTDAMITQELLSACLKELVEDTFNMVSVDGDTSTNDSVVVLANGLAEHDLIKEEDEDYETFKSALKKVMTYLAQNIAADGEGATRLLEATVIHASTKEQAKILAKAIITSNLTKAAVFGMDANWGRILCAMGYSGAEFDPNQVTIRISSQEGTVTLVEHGMATDYDEEEATKILSPDKVTVLADIHAGEQEATAWGCDLTYDYVKINADYRS